LSLQHKFSVPLRSVLVEQRTEVAHGIETRGQARCMEAHESGKRVSRRRSSERVREKESRETHRLPAEFCTHDKLGGSTMVALVKEQIEGALNRWKPAGEVVDS